MTIEELIDILSELPPCTEVRLLAINGWENIENEVEGIEYKEGKVIIY